MTGETPEVHEALAVYAPETTETERVPESYKQTEVGLIPKDWEVRRVGEICDFIVPGRNKPREFDGDIPWITTTDLEGRLSVSESKLGLCVSKDEARSVGSQIVPSGSVIMTCVGDLGIVAIVSRDLVMNQQLHAFIPSEVVDATYLSNALKNQKPYMESLSTKTAVPYLNKDNCNSISIGLPPLHEQRAIAAALSDVDALISALDKLIAKKRAVKTAAMQQLLTGKQRLPGFSGEWEVRWLGEVADIDSDNLTADTDPDYQFNYISLEDVDRGTLRSFSEQRYSSAPSRARRRVCVGDVLVSTVRPNLKSHLLFSVSEGDWVCSTGFSLVRCRKQLASPGFVYQHLFHGVVPKQIEALIAGSNYPAISAKDVRAFQIPMPDVEEQTAIAAVLSDMDVEIEALEARREKTRQVKRGMMQELLTGRTRLV